ncbi:MAG TPA: hypothetical protein VN808_09190 [Stellaceae bacterium]|nr:hypothetical protein [Stellaceae bacterium]
MSATSKASSPARSPERQALADAQERHADAVTQQERVAEAQQRTSDALYGKLLPAIERSREALAAAKTHEPRRLVDAALGKPGTRSTVADAERELADAERRADESRRTRTLLAEEARRASDAVEAARHVLDNAVATVIASDPAKIAAVAEFFRTGRRLLRLARVIRTLNIVAPGVSADDIGLFVRIGDIVQPGNLNSTLYRPDPAFAAALSALRDDPDVALPGLPEPEPDDAGDGSAAEAA